MLLAGSAAALAQAQRPQRVPSWKPKLGVLGSYSEAKVDFVKADGFTSMQLRLDPKKLDDNAIAAIKERMAKAGIWVSSLANDGNHIDPDPAKREAQIQSTIAMIELAGKLGACPASADNRALSKGSRWQSRWRKSSCVYNEHYFKACEQNKVRILWEPYAGYG